MSWSDDMRCLYCDGKLPLYRKITHGQFCSTAHRKAYWQEQERLAVERLNQTHTSLKAFRPPTTVESILGHEPAEVEMGGFVAAVFYPQAQGAPRMLVADPLAYDLEHSPGKPAWNLPEPLVQSLPCGGMILPLREWRSALVGHSVADARSVELVPKSPALLAVLPSLELSAVNGAENDPAVNAAGPVAIALSAIPPSARTIQPQPLAARTAQPAEGIGLSVRPETPEMEPRPASNVERQPPAAEGLFPLTRIFQQTALQACERALPVEQPRETIAAEPLALTSPLARFPDRQVVKTFGPAALAGAVPFMTAQAAPPASVAMENVSAMAAAAAGPSQGGLTISQRQPSFRMGRGSRYPIELCAGSVQSPDVDPVDFPSVPADVVLPAPPPPAEFAPAAFRLDQPGQESPAEESPAQEMTVPEMCGPVSWKVQFGPPAGKIAAPLVSNIATIPQPLRTEPILPSSRLEPLDAKPVSDLMQPEAGEEPPASGSPALKGHVWSRAAGFWKLAPRDLKLLAFAIPLLLALAFHRELPKVRLAATPSTGELGKNIQSVVNSQWTNIRQAVTDRAAVALDEDFRSGLDDWASRDDATAEWSFDSTGFVRPGPLALYRPSMNLTDYQVQFLGMIDKKALSWVVRAADFDNYYVIKLVVLKPGPRTTIGLTRYAVIHGQAVDRVDTVVPLEAQPDTLYRVRLELNGDNFSLGIQGQMVDTWSEPRLPRGGIGFFTAHGEESRIRWVAVTHQYDMLGRLCAYLAPYETPTTNGSW